MIFSLPTCFQSSPTPTLPSRTKCWPVWSPNLPQITSSSSPLPPSDDPVSYHFYHFCYLLSFFNHYLSSSSSLPRPPSPSDDPVCYHEPPPQEISLSLPYISGQDNNSTKADIQKRTSRKYLQWNIKLWPVVPESHIRFISTWFSAYITHRLHNVFDRCRASSSSQVRLSIKRWNCGIGIFHSIGSFPDLTTN